MSDIWGEADEDNIILHNTCTDYFWGEMGSQIIPNQDHLFSLMFSCARSKLFEKPCFKCQTSESNHPFAAQPYSVVIASCCPVFITGF